MAIKIVTDGKKFAIRKGSWLWFYQYYDWNDNTWWMCPEYHEKYCWGDEMTVRYMFKELKEKKEKKIWVVE